MLRQILFSGQLFDLHESRAIKITVTISPLQRDDISIEENLE